MTMDRERLAELEKLDAAGWLKWLTENADDMTISSWELGCEVVIAQVAEKALSDLTAMREENERLRGALAAIAGRDGECGDAQWDPLTGCWRPIREIARQALGTSHAS